MVFSPLLSEAHLARSSRELGLPVLIVAFYPFPLPTESARRMRPVLDCARAEGLAVLDLWEPLNEQMIDTEYKEDELFKGRRENAHLSPAGNRFVAEQVLGFLGRRPDLLVPKSAARWADRWTGSLCSSRPVGPTPAAIPPRGQPAFASDGRRPLASKRAPGSPVRTSPPAGEEEV